MSQRVISVSQLVRYLKSKLDSDALIQKIMIEGEISNFTAHRSGHWYFSLKDANSRINCVMFQTYARQVKMLPKNGDKVIVTCNTSMFESAGQVQLYCLSMKPSGIGDLYVQLELLKEKLRQEGLFAIEHKKQLPTYPMRIGVIVGANTAAREDIMITLKRRWPIAEVLEFHSLVQGDTAHLELIAALLRADSSDCDVLIMARGGGSIEDLWAFNNEDLARYIYACKTPIVTGIGHEVDVTIADFVADVRAATPTAAAETVSCDLSEVKMHILQNEHRLKLAMELSINNLQDKLHQLTSRKVLREPMTLIENEWLKVDHMTSLLNHAMNQKMQQASQVKQNVWKLSQMMTYNVHTQMTTISTNEHKIKNLMQRKLERISSEYQHQVLSLDAYSPLKILSRGYSIVTKNKQTLVSIQQVELHDQIQVRLSDGKVLCDIVEKGELS